MKKICIILTLFFTNLAHAEVVLNKTDGRVFIGNQLEYHEDTDNLSFEEIASLKSGWQTSAYKSIGLGFTKSVCWIRFDLTNKTDRELFLTFNAINTDSINLYILNNDGSYTEKTGGSIYPFQHREVYDKDIFFVIPEHSGHRTLYARIMSNYILEITPEIVPSNKMPERAVKTYLPIALYHGILLALIVYHLFIFFSSKEKTYFVLVLLITGFCLYDLAHDGLGFMFLWPKSIYFESIVIPLSVTIVQITSGIYIQLSVGRMRAFRTVYRLINSYVIAGFVQLLLLFFAAKYINTAITIVFSLYATLVSLSCLFYMGVVKRNRTAFFLFLGFFLFEIGSIIAIATTNSTLIRFIPFLANYLLVLLIMKFTKIWFVLIFSFTLADKINIMRRNLEISEETYKSIFNGTNEAFAILDNESYALVDCNERLLNMLTIERSDIINKSLDATGAVEDSYTKEKAIGIIGKMKGKDSVLFDWRFKKPNGDKLWAEVALSNVILGGKKRILGVIRDISDRKKNEDERKQLMEQLAQSQKMEAVGSLAGGLAHDFNNILTGIMGSSSMLELEIKEKEINISKIEKYIAIILESSQKAAAIVRRLLTMTKKSELIFNPVDLNRSLTNVIEICLNSFPKSVMIQTKYYDKPAIIKADTTGLEQALLNILVNASHALTIMRRHSKSQGGIIAVKIDKQLADETFCKTNLDAKENTTYFSVSVKDNGCGIDKNTIDKIFDPFFTTKSEQNGSGLGLSMVFNIVKLHNGFINVHSEKNAGTTFIVYLPEDNTGKLPEQTDSDTVVQWHGRILVIDDEMFIRTIATDMLSDCGYEVLTASDGNEGIEIFKKDTGGVDAILLDTSMPGLSGLETFKKLRKIDPSIKIIMSSGFSMDKRVQKALDLGADSFIQKPYTNIQLSRVVYDVIS